MSFNRVHAGVLSVVLGFAAVSIADTPVPTTNPAATEADSQPTTAPVALSAGDKDGIMKEIGKEVAITGKIERVSATASASVTFINFDGNDRGDFVAIIKKANLDDVNKGFDGDVSKAITAHKITVTGKVTKFKDTPQLEITKPEQITVLKD